MHGLLRADLVEQLEFLFEQDLIVGQVQAEQGEGFDEGSAPQHHFGAAVRNGVHSGKALEDTDGVIRAQDCYGGAQPDAGCAGGSGGQEDFRR